MATPTAKVGFEIPDQYANQSLRQINQALPNESKFRVDDIALKLGISPEAALTAKQLLRYSTDDPTYSGEADFLNLGKIFGSPISLQDAANREQQNAIAPAVNSLQASIPETQQKFATERNRLTGEVEPLKQRYQTLLDELKYREGTETSRTSTAMAREYGKRGVPLSSGMYDQDVNQKLGDINRYYGLQERGVVGEREQSLKGIQDLIAGLVPQEVEATRAIRNAIAQMQTGASKDALESAFRQLQFGEQQRQFDQQQELSRANQSLAQQQFDFQRQQAAPQSNVRDNFLALGEGQTLFNLLTGQPAFTNPKTYKPSQTFGGGGGDSGW